MLIRNKPFATIDDLSIHLVKKNSKVLDLGCNKGNLGKIMTKRLNSKVIGVEINKKNAQLAKTKLEKVIVGNIENKTIQSEIIKNGPYDVIFASAIIEHLVNPSLTIKLLNKSLKSNGFWIITLPNIAHWSARLLILSGNFEYQESGIFDKTHLHFYTFKSAYEFLIQDCNLNIISFDYELTKIPILNRFFSLLPIYGPWTQSLICRRFPNFFAYQFIFKGQPK